MRQRTTLTVTRRRRWGLSTGLSLLALWAAGQLGRESWWLTGTLFSLLPSPMITSVGVLMALCAWRLRLHRVAAASLVLTLPPLVTTIWVENRWRGPSVETARASTVETEWVAVHWNVARGALGWPQAQQILRAQAADFYLLSEPPRGVDLGTTAQLLGADMTAAELPQMAAVARGELTVGAVRSFDGAVAGLLLWHWRDRNLRVLAIDLPPNQFRPRAPLLRWVVQQIETDAPNLVLGDFNTPRRALLPLPAGYKHAYDAAGCGWSYTWPMPCPLWAIDQAVVGPRVCALRYELVATLRSDHRLQRLRFSP